MDQVFTQHGFLPAHPPAKAFERHPVYAGLDELGRDLPALLIQKDFRAYARTLDIPLWPEGVVEPVDLPELRLYYVRTGFLASGYVNQVGAPRVEVLPKNLAAPLARACKLLGRPPMLSYDGYALYNWKRFRPDGLIALGNIDTLQNFVHLYDEHWFILVHVEIEALAAGLLSAMQEARSAVRDRDGERLDAALRRIGGVVWSQVEVLRRIPEHMDPALYYQTFRPYISFFENVLYEGVADVPLSHRGETGAQSSIMPALVAFLKIPHRSTGLTNHLAEMRAYMPAAHRALLEELEGYPPVRPLAGKETWNDVLEAIATFRETHYGWAEAYIHRRVADPRGTGGTPYMAWLRQLVEETRAAKIE